MTQKQNEKLIIFPFQSCPHFPCALSIMETKNYKTCEHFRTASSGRFWPGKHTPRAFSNSVVQFITSLSHGVEGLVFESPQRSNIFSNSKPLSFHVLVLDLQNHETHTHTHTCKHMLTLICCVAKLVELMSNVAMAERIFPVSPLAMTRLSRQEQANAGRLWLSTTLSSGSILWYPDRSNNSS